MEKEKRKSHEKAGQLWKQAEKKARKMLKPGLKILELAEEIEQFIESQLKEEKLEGGLAFPINLSLNNVAAHATPGIEEKTELKENDLLKVDIGIQVNGFIADGAFSCNSSNEFAKMIESNEKALEEALSVIKPGIEIKKIGETVETIAEKNGFKVIENLTGHGLGKFVQHAPPQISNVRNDSKQKFEDGMTFAIEPFFTNGRGFVADSNQTEIFSLEEKKPVREPNARKILETIEKHFPKLPFAERQLAKQIPLSELQRKIGLRELTKNKILHSYPFLQEQKNAVVSQAEKTVIIDGEEVIVIN
jgi:methionyl aminopeptidase